MLNSAVLGVEKFDDLQPFRTTRVTEIFTTLQHDYGCTEKLFQNFLVGATEV